MAKKHNPPPTIPPGSTRYRKVFPREAARTLVNFPLTKQLAAELRRLDASLSDTSIETPLAVVVLQLRKVVHSLVARVDALEAAVEVLHTRSDGTDDVP